ncbi:MAG: protein-glutamate O-methyltransferase CheR [Actinomycetota bacterium]|nr:protein-glutamate O-methyltransferase CheR [Actinomycetota bacterium]
MKATLSDDEFATVRTLLARAAGLAFDESRRESLGYSLGARIEETGSRSVAAYLDTVSRDPAERQRLLDEVTIQETHFFRNPPQIRALRTHVLPELVRHAATNGKRLRVWSAGCSTGEEPYSVAMMIRELLPSTAGWDVKVVATDVSERALEQARLAVYGARAVQMATPEELDTFFVPHPGGTYEVRQDVRDLVELRHHNLVTEQPPFGAEDRVDLILCRNVTIYFSRDTTRSLMQRLHACLRDGGYLFLGHSETLWQVSDDFRLVALGTGDSSAFVYRRVEPGEERRRVLPDRRTADEGPPPPGLERRQGPRRGSAIIEVLTKPRRLPLTREPARTPLFGAAPVAVDASVDALPAVRAALAEGAYEHAAELAAAMVAKDPMRAEAHYLRGLAMVNLSRDADALVDLRKSVYLDPSSGLAHFLLAGVLARLEDPAAAAREYRAAADTLGRQPTDATATELGGRSVRELAQLCAQLEGQLAGEVR